MNRNIDARFVDAGEAVRAFAELVTPDAARGALVASTGPVDAAALSATAVGPLDATAPTIQVLDTSPSPRTAPAATGAPLVNTAPRKPRGAGVAIAAVVGVVVLGAAGFLGYRAVAGGATPTPTPTPTPTASASATANARDGGGACPAGMVLIEAGNFVMGARDLTADAKPTHKVALHGFCLDRTEVTTGAYLACVKRGECEPAQGGLAEIAQADVELYSPLCNAAGKANNDPSTAWPGRWRTPSASSAEPACPRRQSGSLPHAAGQGPAHLSLG